MKNERRDQRQESLHWKKHTHICAPNKINREKIKKINVKLTTTGDGVYNNNKKNTNQINNTLRE